MEKYDITIIGAGPGGCACALALHGYGLRVLLVDKDVFPRDKICGDAIPGPAFKAMDHIHPAWGRAMRDFARKTEVRTSRIFTPGGKQLSLDWVTYSYNSERIHFDHFLLETVLSRTETRFLKKRLKQICRKNGTLHCHFDDDTSLETSLVIGCDGANSVVKRQLQQEQPASKASVVAVRAYYKGVGGVLPDVNEFHFFKKFPGYFWIFPLAGGYANVGFGAARIKDKHTVNLREMMKEIIETVPEIAARFSKAEAAGGIKGFALPVWEKNKPISGERFMLCGDAASLVDPLQGHGIDKAMWSGILAAGQALSSFESLDFSSEKMSDYDREVYRRMGAAFKKNTQIMQLLLQFPWLFNLAALLAPHQNLINWAARRLKL